MAENGNSSSEWSLDSMRNVNSNILRYFDVQEDSLVRGGQGECRIGKIEFKNNGEQKIVAIKRLNQVFANPENAKNAYRELVLLSLVRHPNLIHLMDVLIPAQIELPLSEQNSAQNVAKFTELFLVTKFGGETLSSEIRRRNLCKTGWGLEEIAAIIFQICAGLEYLHKSGIVHRDLKINNIVLDGKGHLKILDFGCGRYVDVGSKMTPILMVPFYRPPELFLGINSYNMNVDIWSVGCIFSELILGRRLFNGIDFERQWPKFVEVLGSPDLDCCFNDSIGQIRPSYLEYARRLDKIEPKGWENLLPNEMFTSSEGNSNLNAENARDLLAKMLQFDPSKRISASEAMEHPFFDGIRPSNNFEQISNPCKYNFADEIEAAGSVQKWKEKILHKIDNFAKECEGN